MIVQKLGKHAVLPILLPAVAVSAGACGDGDKRLEEAARILQNRVHLLRRESIK